MLGGQFGYTTANGKVIALGRCPTRSADRQVSTDDFRFLQGLLDGTDDAMRRQVANVIAADEAQPTSDAGFDDALWLALAGRVHSAADLEELPPGVRMYFSTRMVEWEIGNGGFAQVFENGVDEYFPAAKAGYLLLGDDASARLLDRARAAAGDDVALDKLDRELEGPPWNGVPWSDHKRIAYARTHRDEFRLPNT